MIRIECYDTGTTYGPLKLPPVGAFITTHLKTGEVLRGPVLDHYEDGTGYVLEAHHEECYVDLLDVAHWVK